MDNSSKDTPGGMVDVQAVGLSGLALDWAAGRADGRELRIAVENEQLAIYCADSGERWNPTSDWNQCGVLLEKHGVHVERRVSAEEVGSAGADMWDAYVYDEDGMDIAECSGEANPREAICLAVVFASLKESEFIENFASVTIQLPRQLVPDGDDAQVGTKRNRVAIEPLDSRNGSGRPGQKKERDATSRQEEQERADRAQGGIGHYLGRVNTYANELRAALVQVNEVLRENGLEPVVIPHMK